MKQCKYCHDDDFPLSGKNILGDRLLLKEVNCKWATFRTQISICPDDKQLAVWVEVDEDNPIIYTHRKIKYCPMCGRKL